MSKWDTESFNTSYNSAYFDMSFDDKKTFESDFDLSFDDTKTFESDMQEMTVVYSSDHKKLKNRDAENQHPIEAITGLKDALDSKQNRLLTAENSGIVIDNDNYIKLDNLILNCGTSTTVMW